MISDKGLAPLQMFPVKVTSTSPFTVQFPDGSTHAALKVAGLTYSTSGTYVAWWRQPAMPVVVPVST